MFLWVHGYLEKEAGTHVRKVLSPSPKSSMSSYQSLPSPSMRAQVGAYPEVLGAKWVSSEPGVVPCAGTSSSVAWDRTSACAAQAEQPVR